MFDDTDGAGLCMESPGLSGGWERGDAGEEGGAGALPTRIDAGAGGAAESGNLLGVGGVVTGAAAAAAVAVRRRRRV